MAHDCDCDHDLNNSVPFLTGDNYLPQLADLPSWVFEKNGNTSSQKETTSGGLVPKQWSTWTCKNLLKAFLIAGVIPLVGFAIAAIAMIICFIV